MSHKSGHIVIDLAPSDDNGNPPPITVGRMVRITPPVDATEDDIVELVRLALRRRDTDD